MPNKSERISLLENWHKRTVFILNLQIRQMDLKAMLIEQGSVKKKKTIQSIN